MDFNFTDKEIQFRNEIREFIKENLPPDFYGHTFTEEHSDEEWEFAMKIAKKMAEKKWLTITWPKEYGGMGATQMEKLIFNEEVGYWGIPGHGMGVGGTAWVGPSLMIFGSEEQKKKYIPLIASADPDGVWCTGYSEPDSGSDLASLQTFAEKKGDRYIINGQKVWTSCAHRSRYCWLAVRTDKNVEKKHHGLSIMIVDMKSKGLTVRPLKNLNGYHFFNEMFFNDVEVPAENLVGVENNGWAQLMKALSFERGMAVRYGSIVRRILDELIHYAKQTGLMKNRHVKDKLTELFMDVQTLRLLSWEADWKMGNNLSKVYEPSRDKAYLDVLLEKISRYGMEILGALSIVDPKDKSSKWTRMRGVCDHMYYMCAGHAIAAGTTNTQRNIVGQFGLQLPKAY